MIKYIAVALTFTLGVSNLSHAQDLSPYGACFDAPETQTFDLTKTVCSQGVKKANGQRTHAIEIAETGIDGTKLLVASRHNMVTGALLAKLADIHHVSNGGGLTAYTDETCKYTYQAKDVFNAAIAKPKPEDPIRLWYQKTETHMIGCAAVAFTKAQAYLKTGQRDKIAETLMPLAYLRNEQARKTLGQMNIQSYDPAPSASIPKPAFSTESAMMQFSACANPDMKALDAALMACETAHRQFRSFAIEASTKSKPDPASDDFFFKSGAAAHQAFRISGAKNREDFKTACNYIGQAMAQFRNVKGQPKPQSQPAMIMMDAQRAAGICAQKGFR